MEKNPELSNEQLAKVAGGTEETVICEICRKPVQASMYEIHYRLCLNNMKDRINPSPKPDPSITK